MISPPPFAKVKPVIFKPSVEPPVIIIFSELTPCNFANLLARALEYARGYLQPFSKALITAF